MRISKLWFLMLLIDANPAFAGWQATQWGSTPLQVSKAMALKFPAGDPHPASPPNGHTYAVSGYSAGGFNFSAAFTFTQAKLAGVHLTLLDGEGDCAALRSALLGKYGKPIEATTSQNTSVWRDIPKDTRVELSILADSFCTVDYTPIRSAATKGL